MLLPERFGGFGIKGFRQMLDFNAALAPLQRSITTEGEANTAAFLCSDLTSGITGEITYVNTVAMGD